MKYLFSILSLAIFLVKISCQDDPVNTGEDRVIADSDTNTTGGLNETTTVSTEQDVIERDFCFNGGTFAKTPNDLTTPYKCLCPPQYVGLRCETYDLCEISATQIRCENGLCVYGRNGQRKCNCFPDDFWDPKEKACRKAEPPCFPNPCQNDGTCELSEGDIHKCNCTEGHEGPKCEIENLCGKGDLCDAGECVLNEIKTKKYCRCLDNFYWNNVTRKCETKDPPCVPNPCQNGGVCTVLLSQQFNCSCSNDYAGELCQERNYCDRNEDGMLCEHGNCTLSDAKDSWNCVCDENYHLDQTTRRCVESVMPCLPNPCHNNGTCIKQSPDEYSCLCTYEYAGRNCSMEKKCELDDWDTFCADAYCIDDEAIQKSYCLCDGSYFDEKTRKCQDPKCEDMCLNGGSCMKTNKTIPFDNPFKCLCPSGYVGIMCETYDLCEISVTGRRCENGMCVYENNERKCKCFPGDFWDSELKMCRKAVPPCFPNPCQNDGICETSEGEGYKCNCTEGHEGLKCEIENLCGKGDLCDAGECALNEIKTKKYCRCLGNFYWNNITRKCETKVPPCIPNPCKNGGVCTASTPQQFNCSCGDDFVGELCQERNYCGRNEDGMLCEHGNCTLSDAKDSWNCVCDENYYLHQTTKQCAENVKPCLPNPCPNNGMCEIYSPYDHMCHCTYGYFGTRCSMKLRCDLEDGHTFCAEASCREDRVKKTFYCFCDEGMHFDYDNRKCIDNKCEEGFCMNGGTCVETANDTTVPFKCLCLTGYVGLRCETSDLCETSELGIRCENGRCVYEKGQRKCKCFLGDFWDSEDKECREAEPPCFPNPCLNDGVCQPIGEKDYKCACKEGHEGERCQIENVCSKGDLCNNGECVLNKLKTRKYCRCFSSFYFNKITKKCEEKVPPCLPNPCKNGGVCTIFPSKHFNCSCGDDYAGEYCQEKDNCGKNEDGLFCYHGKCVFSESESSWNCVCVEGYHLDPTTRQCVENVKPCLPNPCRNNGVCVRVSYTEHTCICSQEYTGNDCSFENRCILDDGNTFCSPASCKMNHEFQTYTCSCAEGQAFDYETRKCEVLDLCPLVTSCGKYEVCFNGTCKCEKYFKRNNETKICEPNFCTHNLCPATDMLCDENFEGDPRDFQCYCAKGYSFNGTHCISAFCVFPELNDCSQKCVSKTDGYTCACHKGFKLNEDKKTCEYSGQSPVVNATCLNGVCDTEECKKCMCKSGFTENNGSCINLCDAGKFPEGYCPFNSCESSVDKIYRCKCNEKYTHSKDELTCVRRRMCSKYEMGWAICQAFEAQCVDDWASKDGYHCNCSFGYEPNKDGICRKITDVEEHQKQCSIQGGTSDIDLNGEAACRCPPYLQLSEKTKRCDAPAKYSYLVNLPLSSEHYAKPTVMMTRNMRSLDSDDDPLDYHLIWSDITRSMNQLYEGFENANVLNCGLMDDYLLCKVELRFEIMETRDLDRIKIPGVCQKTEKIPDYCIIAPSLVLRADRITSDVLFTVTDPCEVDIKEELCGSETECQSSVDKKNFNCTCKAGFTLRKKVYPFNSTDTFVEVCKDTDECLNSEACPQNTECINTLGSYECTCLVGFRAINDESDPKEDGCIELCKPNPCVHGRCNVIGAHSYECRCDVGYKGYLCNVQDKDYKRAKTNTIIVGVVLGGILLITGILFAASIARLKKKKYLEDPGHIMYNAAEMTERRPVGMGATNNAFLRD